MENPFLIAAICVRKSIRIQKDKLRVRFLLFILDVLCLCYSGIRGNQNCQQPLLEKELQEQDSCVKDLKNNESYGNVPF